MSLTPEQRTLRARVAAHSMHAAGKTNTAAARRAFDARFAREVDPDGTLPEQERARRAAHARRAHFQRLALASAKSRQQAAASR